MDSALDMAETPLSCILHCSSLRTKKRKEKKNEKSFSKDLSDWAHSQNECTVPSVCVSKTLELFCKFSFCGKPETSLVFLNT